MRSLRVLSVASGVVGTMALLAITTGPAAAADQPSGTAFAVQADASLLSTVTVTVPATPTASYPEGAHKSVVTLHALHKGNVVSARVLNASAQPKNAGVTSAASVTELSALGGLIQAKLLTANCSADRTGLHGDSKVAQLTVGGKKLTVTGDKPVSLNRAGKIVPGGVITIRADEQIRNGDTLTVNALHITVGGVVKSIAKADIIISQARCTGTPAPTDSPSASAPAPASPTASAPGGSGGNGGGQGSGELPVTGTSLTGMIIGGIALLAAGVGAVFFARRRRARA